MNRPSVKLSLIGSAAGMVLLTAALSWVSINSLSTINVKSDEIVDNWMPSIERSKEMDTALSDLRVAFNRNVLAATAQEESDAENLVEAEKARFSQALDDYAVLVSEPGEKAELSKIRGKQSALFEAGTRLTAAMIAGNREEAKRILAEEMRPHYLEIDKAVDAIVLLNKEGAARSGTAIQQMLEEALRFVYILCGVALLVGTGAIGFAVAGIANPIGRITAAMRNLASGDAASAIPFAGRHDEIGAMAEAVEVFRQNALANARMEQEAIQSRSSQDAERVEVQRRTEREAEALRFASENLAAGLKQLAGGNLTFQIDEAFALDFEPLRQDFNQSVRQLGAALGSIAESIGTMDNGTREIASGAQDLSKRTEQQAAALEETAAALDQITANVGSSTTLTEEARTVANQANQSAAKSAEVVAHAEEAMRRIEESSQQISNIIGVIDEIAFQTNLLALNAGVEAARAGDAGKGFAVVAQEVRELAQRSAQAAKEIKGLIRNSTTEVESGVKLVRDTGEALNVIGGFIGQINGHMNAIAVSAKEQSTGLAEINTAVNSMDQNTQQNAAMVEQSTAAASSLAEEATKLRDLIAGFKLDGASRPRAVSRTSISVASPAHALGNKVARAFSAKGSAAAAVNEWTEF
ncbi:HAMP domain-containing methyl-accepting chemotaxis protein [Agrobacterium rhizogenes]|uniref:methyl-accepting chemotaxis protein n=1 Tax=Rhizobium rhizogenes TaxID=359 RepID=UPI0022B72DF3|nr:HAMP domain-containing methyl-accepting chemotaxis protein [Rhizobium rhizogenes]MCZ7451302.1 HAMP domain-containing methyl-accepting chemotaxis protein [Rhizobium rhizogenes]